MRAARRHTETPPVHTEPAQKRARHEDQSVSASSPHPRRKLVGSPSTVRVKKEIPPSVSPHRHCSACPIHQASSQQWESETEEDELFEGLHEERGDEYDAGSSESGDTEDECQVCGQKAKKMKGQEEKSPNKASRGLTWNIAYCLLTTYSKPQTIKFFNKRKGKMRWSKLAKFMHTIPELQGRTNWLLQQPTQTLRNKTNSLCRKLFSGNEPIFCFNEGKSNVVLQRMVPKAKEFFAAIYKVYRVKLELTKRQDRVFQPIGDFWQSVFCTVPVSPDFVTAQQKELERWKRRVYESETPEAVGVPATLRIFKGIGEQEGEEEVNTPEEQDELQTFLFSRDCKGEESQEETDSNPSIDTRAQEMVLFQIKSLLDYQERVAETARASQEQMERLIEETKNIRVKLDQLVRIWQPQKDSGQASAQEQPQSDKA